MKTPTWESLSEAVETAPPAGGGFQLFLLVLKINSWKRCSHTCDERTRWLQEINPSFVHPVWDWTLNGWDLFVIKSKRIRPTHHRQTCYLSHTEPEELSQNWGTLEDQKELEKEPEEFHWHRRELIWLLPVESAEPRSHGGLKDHSSVQRNFRSQSKLAEMHQQDLDPLPY